MGKYTVHFKKNTSISEQLELFMALYIIGLLYFNIIYKKKLQNIF